MFTLDIIDRWQQVKFSSLFTENKCKNSDFTSSHALQFYFGTLIPKKKYALTNDLIDTYKKYIIVEPGDIVINGLNLNYDFVTQRVAIVEENGIITSAYLVIRPSVEINNKYYCYFLKALDSHKIFNGMGRGIRLTLSYKDLKNYPLPLPPLSEQDKIARYLDYKVSRINKLISLRKKQLIDLAELKKVIINNSVTKGLNPNAELKQSGVKWLGEIAEDAEIIRLKYFSYIKGRIGWQGLGSKDFIDEGPYCVTGTDFKNGHIDWRSCYHVSEERYEMDSSIHIKEGDLLITKDGTIGKLAIVDNLPDKACLNSHLLIIRPLGNKYLNKFLYYVMQSSIFSNYYGLLATGAIMNSLSQRKIANFTFPVYSLTKQHDIVSYLDDICGKIDRLITLYEREISLFDELKARLISDCVTGQLDLRDIII